MGIKEQFHNIIEEIQKNDASYTRIAFTGQPGAGKSTLINTVTGKKMARTGIHTDTTTVATEYEHNFQRLVDLPGYGTEKFSYDKWKTKFNPSQYDVLIYVFRGKFTDDDEKFFLGLNKFKLEGKVIILVRNFSGGMTNEDRNSIKMDLSKRLNFSGNIIFTECHPHQRDGIDKLRDSIYTLNFQQIRKDRIIRAFKDAREEYLVRAWYEADDIISSHAKVAGVNGLNPFPGIDVAADIGIYISMFGDIRNKYDIGEADFKEFAFPISKKLLELLTKQGILIILKNFAGRQTAKTVLKYIPFVGQAAAAGIGYKMAVWAGEQYREDCRKFAFEALNLQVEEETKKLLAE